ncbi:putative N-terminal acetyltransferase complex ARD1 subunit [Giardia muris]|uniref:Putative N-terminal acetyltransferase complex ARD1 subunit n=1 Tax=Giardia muris TaxID=5742 RepID=A0A4Z1SMZ4_GIAMU|nr:putative N-terminal acetyltransferase complex ARD1 subunit [Giardia muris]|eukprot:TNJ27102.1 putative N-terminal acetyltransferase complex ARD1 subunit [Giardia muris]
MFCIRRAECGDFPAIQRCNLACLPENYPLKYFLQHALKWPQLTYLCETMDGVVGYAMGKLDDEEDPVKAHGHITSVAVRRDWRGLGIAEALMQQVLGEMRSTYGVTSCKLNVRVSNAGAQRLYKDRLGFTVEKVDRVYFQDHEDSQFLTCELPLSKGLRPIIACFLNAAETEVLVDDLVLNPEGSYSGPEVDAEQLGRYTLEGV